MPAFTDALRGYAFAIHERDGFKCVYCGLDGTDSFTSWLSLSSEHLLPKWHPHRNDSEFLATACMFCNIADNWLFLKAESRNMTFDSMTREELIAQRKPFVTQTRASYREFWDANVCHR